MDAEDIHYVYNQVWTLDTPTMFNNTVIVLYKHYIAQFSYMHAFYLAFYLVDKQHWFYTDNYFTSSQLNRKSQTQCCVWFQFPLLN